MAERPVRIPRLVSVLFACLSLHAVAQEREDPQERKARRAERRTLFVQRQLETLPADAEASETEKERLLELAGKIDPRAGRAKPSEDVFRSASMALRHVTAHHIVDHEDFEAGAKEILSPAVHAAWQRQRLEQRSRARTLWAHYRLATLDERYCFRVDQREAITAALTKVTNWVPRDNVHGVLPIDHDAFRAATAPYLTELQDRLASSKLPKNMVPLHDSVREALGTHGANDEAYLRAVSAFLESWGALSENEENLKAEVHLDRLCIEANLTADVRRYLTVAAKRAVAGATRKCVEQAARFYAEFLEHNGQDANLFCVISRLRAWKPDWRKNTFWMNTLERVLEPNQRTALDRVEKEHTDYRRRARTAWLLFLFDEELVFSAEERRTIETAIEAILPHDPWNEVQMLTRAVAKLLHGDESPLRSIEFTQTQAALFEHRKRDVSFNEHDRSWAFHWDGGGIMSSL